MNDRLIDEQITDADRTAFEALGKEQDSLSADDISAFEAQGREHDEQQNIGAVPAFTNVGKEQAKMRMGQGSPEALNDAQRIWAQQQPLWNIVKAFGHGYGETYLDEVNEIASDVGESFNKNYVERTAPVGKALMDGFIIPSARVMFTTYLSAPYGAYQAAAVQVGKEAGSEQLGSDLAALPEAFPFDIYKPIAGGRLPRPVAEAKVNRVLDGEGVYFGTREPTEMQAKNIEEATAQFRSQAAEMTAKPVPTVHDIAREISPDVFTQFDSLKSQRDMMRNQMSTLRTQRAVDVESALPHTAEINSLKTKLEDANPRMTKKYQARIEELEGKNQTALGEALRTETEEMASLRQELQKTDYAMRDLAPEVSRSYREAEGRMPKEEIAEIPVKAAEEVPVMAAEDPTLTENPQSPVEPVKPVEQQHAFIIGDLSKKLIESGRPGEEAEAAAQLVAARYQARSEWFEGQYGTAEEMYVRDFADVRAGRERKRVRELSQKVEELDQKAKGKIRLATDEAKATISLFKTADASTFIHETGHHWLDELMRDALHEKAPAQMKKDTDAVRKWLGNDGGELSTRQHEKWARGFERFMMEGVAPSKELKGIFGKFQQWLNSIYQVVDRLKAPINDDIRDVFHRLLSSNPEKTVVTAERPGEMMAAIHETEARTTLPKDSAPVRDTIEKEIDKTAKQHNPEIADGLKEPRSDSQAGALESAPPVSAGIHPETGAVAARPGIDAELAPQPTSGNAAVGESGAAPTGTAGAIPEAEIKVSEAAPQSPNTKLGPPESALIDKAGNIRLDNLNTPEDVNQVLRDAAAQNDQFLGARRNVISDAQVLDLADALGMSPETLSVRKLGQAFNAEEIVAARKLLIQSADDVRDLMKQAATGSDDIVMAYAEAKARHRMIQEQVSGITAEAGRALRAFRQLEGGKEATALGEFLKEATGKDLFQLKEEAILGSQLETAAQVSKFINDSAKPKFSDMVLEYWINALLSGPTTHVKNIIGNAAISVNATIETVGAAGVGKIREVLGNEGDKVHLVEAKARLFGISQGSKEGLRAGVKAFKTEELSGAHTIEQANRKNIPGKAGKIIRIPGRFLSAQDELFKAIAYRQELNAQAYRTASKDGLTGDAFNQRVADIVMNPSEELMSAAKKNAEYQTFTKQLGPVGRAIQTFSNSHFLAKLVVPFIRTPVNILKYAGERTPLGVFSREVRDNLSGVNGKIAQDTQIARVAIGTAIGSAVMSLAQDGTITGGGPSNPAEKAMWRQVYQPYSVKVGDMYYSYAWLDPFATIMGVSADMAEISKAGHDNDEDMTKIATAVFSSISKNLMAKLSLRGVSDLIQAVTDPDRYGGTYINNLVGTAIPSFVAQGARTQDPTMRQAREWTDALKARVPGMRETLLPVRDVWGEAIVRQGNLGLDAVSPVYEQKINNDPVNQALLKLRVFPAKPDRKIRGVELTDQQYDNYSRVAGRMAKMQLNQLVAQPGFEAIPDFNKVKVINKIISTSRERARSLIMMQNPNIMQQATENKLREIRGTKD